MAKEKFDCSVKWLELDIEIQELDDEYNKMEKRHHRITKHFLSYEELLEQLDEGYIAKLPRQLADPSFENELFEKVNFREAISKLSEKQRKRIFLYFFCDFSISKIAKLENADYKTVKKV